MINRNDNIHDTDRISHPIPDRSSTARTATSKLNSDEIIMSLANTYENKRARQVGEWERVQAANFRRPI
jgi:hypothetical protein